MAPQRKNKRLNVPGSRTPATYDLKNQEHFNKFKQEGFIPNKYNNYAELQDDFLALVYEGMSDADAAEALGVDYRNVIGKGYLAAELSSKGIPRGINVRTLREDIKPDERSYLIERFGKDWFDAYQRYRKLEWGDAKVLKKDKELIEQFSGRPVEEFTSAKQEADILRDRLAAAFGKGGRAGQVHRGHGVSAMEGASVGKANLMPESGPLNVGHGSNPRYDYNVMRNLNMSANDLQNAYDDKLQREGLTINPRRYPGNYVSADEFLRELKQGTSLGNPQVTVPVEPTKVDPRSIEWRDRRFFEIEQQLAGEYERAGMSPGEAEAKARQRVEEYALSQSTMFNTDQTRGGPVTVIQQGNQMPRQIGTVVGEQLVDPFGRPKFDRSGEPKLETRPLYEPPSGAILAPNPAITRSQSLGKTAAAIANREPVPQPKPAVVPQPAAAPQPQVGQPAIKNGKPVVWSGGKWMPVPAPKAKLTDTLTKDSITAARLARNVAPMWASVPLSAALAGESIKAAVTTPNPDTIETAGWDTANLLADVATFVPMPIVSGAAEGLQKTLGIAQASREGQKWVSKQTPKPKPAQPVNRLSPQQIESFRAGGGNAAMSRYNLTIQQVIERGSQARLNKS